MDENTLAAALLSRAAAARPGATFCPSEVARALAANWRPLMPPLRAAAAALQDQGRLIVTRGGAPVDARSAGGPIRLRRP